MIAFGKVKEIANDFIKSLVFGKTDARTAPQCLPHGIDSKPVKDALSVYCQMDSNSKSVMLGYISKSDKTKSGETRLYATDSDGNEVFSVLFDGKGDCHFGGSSDNFVRYSRLNTALTTHDTSTNAEFTKIAASLQAINNYLTGLGILNVPYKQATVTTNISAAKIDNIFTS